MQSMREQKLSFKYVRSLQDQISKMVADMPDTSFASMDNLLDSVLSTAVKPLVELLGITRDELYGCCSSPNFVRALFCTYHSVFAEDRDPANVDHDEMVDMLFDGAKALENCRRAYGELKIKLNCSINNKNSRVRKYRETDSDLWVKVLSKQYAPEIPDRMYTTLEQVVALIVSQELTEARYLAYDNEKAILTDFAQQGWFRNKYAPLSDYTTHINGMEVSEFEYVFGVDFKRVMDAAQDYQDWLARSINNMLDGVVYEEHEHYLDTMSELQDKTIRLPEELIFSPDTKVDGLPQQVKTLANKLSRIHGPVKIARESSGLHIYIPDPELLEEDGAKELSSKHLAINADKYFGIGKYDIDNYRTAANIKLWKTYYSIGREVMCASSMKTHKAFKVSELLKMRPIEQRDLDFDKEVIREVQTQNSSDDLELDDYGKLVPKWCGDTVPLSELPPDHPAVRYMLDRGYDIDDLSDRLDVSYCKCAAKKGATLTHGLTNDATGRIILPIMMDGSRVSYQARMIDTWHNNMQYVWNGTSWTAVAKRTDDGIIIPVCKTNKYLNPKGASRNMLLFGYDQAVAWNKEHGRYDDLGNLGDSYCILVEGPLDVARLKDYPAMAVLGAFLSPIQASYIRRSFKHVAVIMDTDDAGKRCRESIEKQLPGIDIIDVVIPRDCKVKDVGELDYDTAFVFGHRCDPRNI